MNIQKEQLNKNCRVLQSFGLFGFFCTEKSVKKWFKTAVHLPVIQQQTFSINFQQQATNHTDYFWEVETV